MYCIVEFSGKYALHYKNNNIKNRLVGIGLVSWDYVLLLLPYPKYALQGPVTCLVLGKNIFKRVTCRNMTVSVFSLLEGDLLYNILTNFKQVIASATIQKSETIKHTKG